MSNLKLKLNHNVINHKCQLNFTRDSGHRRMVGIIGTIGPSCRSVEMIYELIKAGMTMVRINFSHETRKDHELSLQYIDEAQKMYSKEIGYFYPLAIVADLKGREIRTGNLYSRKPVDIKRGDTIKLSINEALANRGTKEAIFVDYPSIIKHVQVGQRVFLNDNAVTLEVVEIGVDCLICRLLSDGALRDNMSLVVPGSSLDMPVVSDKDISDIKFCIERKVDFFLLSKLRTAEDVRMFKEYICSRERHAQIFTKLENVEVLENLDDILVESDGVILVRSDLAVELSIGKIFLAQKAIAARCNRTGKPIIIGTQLLMSMNNNINPKRTDIVDIGNAILDGADCLMLSSETAIGQHPVEAMRTLARTAAETEGAVWHQKLFKDLIDQNADRKDSAHAIAVSAVMASMTAAASAIFVITVSGKSAHLVSMYRPRCAIFVITRCSRVARKMNVCRAVIPLLISDADKEKRLTEALNLAHTMGIVKENDAVIVLSPSKKDSGYTNNVSLIYARFT